MPKQFLLLKDKPILQWTLEAFMPSDAVHEICLVVPENQLDETKRDFSNRYRISSIVAGGETRQDSVRNGFEKIPRCDVVLVHDAVRPFITAAMIERVIEGAVREGGAVLGLPQRETLKDVGEDRAIVRTVNRETIWSVQTPQGFRYAIFEEALRRAKEDHFVGTDEAMLVERLGKKIVMVEGSPLNIKITLPEDLILAEGIVDARRNRV